MPEPHLHLVPDDRPTTPDAPSIRVLTGGRISGARSRHEERKRLVDEWDRLRRLAHFNPSPLMGDKVLAAKRAVDVHDVSWRDPRSVERRTESDTSGADPEPPPTDPAA